MKEFIDSRETLIKNYKSDAGNGLTDSQAEVNRSKYGSNVLTKRKADSFFKRLWSAITEPMLLMLVAAGAIALGVNIYRDISGCEGDYLECIGVFVAIAISVVISMVMEGKSAKAFEALSKISDNIVIKAVRNGNTVNLNQDEVVVGDIIILATGDKIPADARLLESVGLSVDESSLTGESVPVSKDEDADIVDEKTPLAERKNMLYRGTYITEGHCKAVVTATGDNTEFGKIAKELGVTDKTTTPLQEKLARMGKIITILGIIAAAVVFVTEIAEFAIKGNLNATSVMDAFVTSIVLIVAAVPEGLPTIVAVSLSINVIKLARNNALVKKMIASETVGCINVICSDKTGTLTENNMTVGGFYDNEWHEDPSELTCTHLIHNICLNTTADIGEKGEFIGNASECAMLNFYKKSKVCQNSGKDYTHERDDHENIISFPFSSDLKHMTTVSDIDGNIISYVKGSPECVMQMCDISADRKEDIEKYITAAQKKAMRVIAFAHKELAEVKNFEDEDEHRIMESGMTFDGFVAISDPLRADVYEAVNSCKDAGIALKILTGDNIVTATAIAEELNLFSNGGIAIEAREIDEMTDEELLEKLADIRVIARSTPTVKMRVVKLLKETGNVVAVTGDGINDAPALKNADVGIAMGINGTEVSKEASDIVLLDDSFSTIVKAIEWGRNIYENFKRFISFQLTVNMASVIVVFVSVIMGFDAPFTALQLLWINIIMDGPPALTLGLEPGYKDQMKMKPVGRNENIISKPMFARIALTGIFVSVVFLLQYCFNFLGASDAEMKTVLFTMFVFFHLFNAFNCRELHKESIFKHIFKNKAMLIVTACTFAIQIVIIQFGGAFFGTVSLDLAMWLKITGIAVSVIVISEIIKLISRGLSRNR